LSWITKKEKYCIRQFLGINIQLLSGIYVAQEISKIKSFEDIAEERKIS
jgi:hypothetical protein